MLPSVGHFHPIPHPTYKVHLTPHITRMKKREPAIARQGEVSPQRDLPITDFHIALPESLWDSPRLASYLGCSPRHIFNLRKRGLPALRVGEMVRFDPARVLMWLDSQNGREDLRSQQLSAIAAEEGEASECAAADLSREFPLRT